MTDTTNTSANTARSEKPKGIQFVAEIELRDYFAAKAMHAALVTAEGYGSFEEVAKRSADLAYMVADAMLEARKK